MAKRGKKCKKDETFPQASMFGQSQMYADSNKKQYKSPWAQKPAF